MTFNMYDVLFILAAYPIELGLAFLVIIVHQKLKGWRLNKKYSQMLDRQWSLECSKPVPLPQEEMSDDIEFPQLYALEYAEKRHLLDTGQVKALKVNPNISLHSIRLRSITNSLEL